MADTKTALLDCAEKLIQRVGVNAMSYKDLSEQVGIRKASIHYHFPKKEDLIVSLLGRCREENGRVYEEIIESSGSAKEKLYKVAELFKTSLKAGKVCAVGMLSVEFESLGEEAQKATELSIQSCSKVFEKIFVQAVEEGLLPESTNTYDAAYGFFCFLLGTQVLSRCTTGPEGFHNAVKMYIESLFQK